MQPETDGFFFFKKKKEKKAETDGDAHLLYGV